MIAKLILVMSLLFATLARGETFEPCSPVFLAGPQGRPIPNNVVQITTLANGAVPGGVWNDANGDVQFGNVLPPNQILQVYARGGTYRVTVSGDGLTKQYQIVCGEFYGGDAKKISIDRTADVMNSTPAPGATLVTPTGGTPSYLSFSNSVQQSASFDFIMPSFPLTLDEFRMSWRASAPGLFGDSYWRIASCIYVVGMTPCIPPPATSVLVTSTTPVGGFRIDQIVPVPGTWTWYPNAHVVVHITRFAGAGIAAPVYLENVRLEFRRP